MHCTESRKEQIEMKILILTRPSKYLPPELVNVIVVVITAAVQVDEMGGRSKSRAASNNGRDGVPGATHRREDEGRCVTTICDGEGVRMGVGKVEGEVEATGASINAVHAEE